MNISKRILALNFILIAGLWSYQVEAQESLQQQYQNILENTETFERYKVIPKGTLDNFWLQVNDSIQVGKSTIIQLKSQISAQQIQIDSLKKSLGSVKVELQKSKEVNDNIYFIGIPFSKFGYHIMVWSIIVVLTILGLVAYFMFIRSNSVTSKSRKELQALKAQFESHKDQAREKQVKLKRELQTAVNTIDEIKRGKR